MSDKVGETVTYEAVGRVCYVQMERPDAMNALSDALKIDLVAALAEYGRDDDLRALVLSGCDCGAFSAGGDLKKIANEFSGGVAVPPAPVPDLFAAFHACEKPLIAAVDGFAVGGGCEMAISCDIRVATTRSSFGMPEPRWGMLGSYGLDALCRTVPIGEAMRMQLTGSRISAERAYQVGLIQELAADRGGMFAAATAIASDIAKCSPHAVREVKRIVLTGRNLPLDDAQRFSAPSREAARLSDDAAEGTKAFAEKRQPSWAT